MTTAQLTSTVVYFGPDADYAAQSPNNPNAPPPSFLWLNGGDNPVTIPPDATVYGCSVQPSSTSSVAKTLKKVTGDQGIKLAPMVALDLPLDPTETGFIITCPGTGTNLERVLLAWF